MTAPHVQRLSPTVCATGQLETADIAWAAGAGFKSVVNNRPDGEGGSEQPTSAQMQAAAIAAGLRYEYLPVSPAFQSPEEIARFAELLSSLPTPILAFCRSGARSTRLFQAATGA